MTPNPLFKMGCAALHSPWHLDLTETEAWTIVGTAEAEQLWGWERSAAK